MDSQLHHNLHSCLRDFTEWLEKFGEISQDQYDFWATRYGRWVKSAYYSHAGTGVFLVAPLVFLDSFCPASRRVFRKMSRFPIADAHYALGFAYLHQATGKDDYYRKAVHFLHELLNTACKIDGKLGWGYPFPWMTNRGLIPAFTPLITTTPYVYEAFFAVYSIDQDPRWREILLSIASHVAEDYADLVISPRSSACSYTAVSERRDIPVINANSYRAFVLLHAAKIFANDKFHQLAERNLNFVLDNQQMDGSWYYAVGHVDQFVDHFHTCFVLKNLIKINQIIHDQRYESAISQGLEFYQNRLFDLGKLPVPFARKQRLTPFRRELYDYAECLNLAVLLTPDGGALPEFCRRPLQDLLDRWRKADGSFRTRQLWIGWNDVPYHRWAQSQTFRSLSLLFMKFHTNHKPG